MRPIYGRPAMGSPQSEDPPAAGKAGCRYKSDGRKTLKSLAAVFFSMHSSGRNAVGQGRQDSNQKRNRPLSSVNAAYGSWERATDFISDLFSVTTSSLSPTRRIVLPRGTKNEPSRATITTSVAVGNEISRK